jgi:hypothetical protein
VARIEKASGGSLSLGDIDRYTSEEKEDLLAAIAHLARVGGGFTVKR